jgi:hypothetical protein
LTLRALADGFIPIPTFEVTTSENTFWTPETLEFVETTLVVVSALEAVTFPACAVVPTRDVMFTEVMFAFVANIFENGTVTFPIPAVEEPAKMFP